jgi:hypothetical protein
MSSQMRICRPVSEVSKEDQGRLLPQQHFYLVGQVAALMAQAPIPSNPNELMVLTRFVCCPYGARGCPR